MGHKGHRGQEAARVRERLARLAAETADLTARLAELEAKGPAIPDGHRGACSVTNASTPSEKIALFRTLFYGREDVFPRRWENVRTGRAGYAPACGNEWKPQVCGKPRVKCGACPNQAFLPVTDEVIEGHLRGRHTIGVYPIRLDDTCRFLAADFDRETWKQDAQAFLEACRSKQVPAALERSRSGNGGDRERGRPPGLYGQQQRSGDAVREPARSHELGPVATAPDRGKAAPAAPVAPGQSVAGRVDVPAPVHREDGNRDR